MADNKVSMSFRVEPDIKQEFENVCEKIGISPSEAICVYLHKVVAKQAIPFDVKLDEDHGNGVRSFRIMF